MSRFVTAKAELERALRSTGRLERAGESSGSRRYAAVTVMQPYAWLIAHAPRWPAAVEGKTIENRGRPTSYRGPVLIHVSRRWELVDRRLAQLRELGLVGGVCPEPDLTEMRSQLGQVIARAELRGCRRVGDRDPHPWAIPGSWGWLLEGIELVEPFGLRGHPGLRFAPPELELRVQPYRRFIMLGGLPSPGAGVRFDASAGRGSVEVSSLVEAAGVALRVGLSGLRDVVELDGEQVTVASLFARAAEELGERNLAATIRRRVDERPAGCAWLPSNVRCDLGRGLGACLPGARRG